VTPKEALVMHLTSIFPIVDGLTLDISFTWKAVVFILCLFLAWKSPIRNLWSGLLVLGLAPTFLLADQSDIVSKIAHIYLIWMCAEATFRSVACDPEIRVAGWWLFPLTLVFFL
jgi:hypothetical protein